MARYQSRTVTRMWPFLGYSLVTFFIGLIIEVIGSTDGCGDDSEICWKNGFFAFLGDGIYAISALLFLVFFFLFLSYPFRVGMSPENIGKKTPTKKSNRASSTVKHEPREKILDGWLKICESCSSEFRVILKEKELGFVDSMKAIKKMARLTPISKKDWSIGNKPERHFCANCLKRGNPSEWYCQHCKGMGVNCDCFEIIACSDCGEEVTRLTLHGTVCQDCAYEYYASQSPYEAY